LHVSEFAEESYLNEVDLVEAVIASGSLDIQNRDDVFVVEVAEQLHLTEGSETKHGVVERSNLLDGDFLTRGLVDSRASFTLANGRGTRSFPSWVQCLPDNSVSTLTNNVLDIILLADVEGDLARVRTAGLSCSRHGGQPFL
jgi:hypothetical protein